MNNPENVKISMYKSKNYEYPIVFKHLVLNFETEVKKNVNYIT